VTRAYLATRKCVVTVRYALRYPRRERRPTRTTRKKSLREHSQ
jgi:hypothetical protein